MQTMYRQGDVLLKRIDTAIPATAKAVDCKKEGRVILAYGEVTGHAHALGLMFASMFTEDDGKRYLEVKEGAQLTHEEHATITPEAGCYQIIQQVEYTPTAIRNVQD